MTYAFDWPRDVAVAPTAARTVTPPVVSDRANPAETDHPPHGRTGDDRDTTSDIVWTLAYWPWL
jgi:hypothetical protein